MAGPPFWTMILAMNQIRVPINFARTNDKMLMVRNDDRRVLFRVLFGICSLFVFAHFFNITID